MSIQHCTESVSQGQVQAYWQDAVCRTYVPIECQFDTRQPFRGRLSVRDLGRTQLTKVDSGPVNYVRSAREIKRSGDDGYMVCLLTQGTNRFMQAGRETEIGVGELCLFDTAKTYTLECPSHYKSILLKIPRQDFDVRVPTAERISAMRVPANGHFAQLASTMLRKTADMVELDSSRAHRLVPPLVDLIALAFDECFAMIDLDQSRYQRIIDRAQEVMMDHLFDPDFDLSTVPAIIGVSTRTFSRAFAHKNLTPSKWLWQQRLDAARNLLESSRGNSISEIAFTCGFNDFSHFSRAFKRRFNVAPSAVRAR